jgi:FAD/FMN-containing dehydrogenase
VELGLEMLFRRVVELGGTLTGEHGVGLSKRRFLPLEQSAPLIELQRGLKRVFDPHALLNPGKVFPEREGHGAC